MNRLPATKRMMAAMMVVVRPAMAMVMLMKMAVVVTMDVTTGMMMRRPRRGRRNEGKYCNRKYGQRGISNYSTRLTQLHHSWIPCTPPILATTCRRDERGL
jgi:hypothetical protein